MANLYLEMAFPVENKLHIWPEVVN